MISKNGVSSGHRPFRSAVLWCSATALQYYDMSKPATEKTDASNTFTYLGAVLVQEDKPVAYASRTLMRTERGSARIEKECSGILFGCECFRQYLFARNIVHVERDHKTLEILFRKPLLIEPKMLQRMRFIFQGYNLSVSYKRRTLLYIADALSRAPQESDESSAWDPEVKLYKELEVVHHAN